MRLVLVLMLLACKGERYTPTDAKTPAEAAVGAEPDSQTRSGAGTEDDTRRQPVGLSQVDPSAPEQPAARSLAEGMRTALAGSDATGAIALMSTQLEEAEGSAMVADLAGGVSISPGPLVYAGMLEGSAWYLSDAVVTESGQPVELRLLFVVGPTDAGGWQVVDMQAWPQGAQDAAPAPAAATATAPATAGETTGAETAAGAETATAAGATPSP